MTGRRPRTGGSAENARIRERPTASAAAYGLETRGRFQGEEGIEGALVRLRQDSSFEQIRGRETGSRMRVGSLGDE
jgi:hypothetical protein